MEKLEFLVSICTHRRVKTLILRGHGEYNPVSSFSARKTSGCDGGGACRGTVHHKA